MRVLGEKRTYLLKTETGNTGKQGYAIQGVHKKVASLYLGNNYLKSSPNSKTRTVFKSPGSEDFKIVLDSEIWPSRS